MLSDLFRRGMDEPSWYDTMQVCLNGHVINDCFKAHPQFNRKFCEKCGTATIATCQKCGKDIPGYYHAAGIVSLVSKDKPPDRCGECGGAFPWTVKKTPESERENGLSSSAANSVDSRQPDEKQGGPSMSVFSPDDKVRLKAAGGPEMVVDRLDPEQGVVCAYMDTVKGSLRHVSYREELLERADAQACSNRLDLDKCGRYVGPAKEAPSKRVFIVHGHDEAMKQEVARVLLTLELDPIILHELPNEGRTIIEKFEKNADVGFAVVLLSGDDMAYPSGTEHKKAKPRPRARQNVVMELGYFVAKLGRDRVLPLYKEVQNFELPSDFQGVVYTPYDPAGGWRGKLVQELQAAKYDVDANKLFKK